MDLFTCKHCGANRVLPMEDDNCPNCKKPLAGSPLADSPKPYVASDAVPEEGGRKRSKAGRLLIVTGALVLAASVTCLIIGAKTKGEPVRTGGPTGAANLSPEEARPLVQELVDGGYSGMRPLLSMIDKEIAATQRRRTWWYVASAALGLAAVVVLGLGIWRIASPGRKAEAPQPYVASDAFPDGAGRKPRKAGRLLIVTGALVLAAGIACLIIWAKTKTVKAAESPEALAEIAFRALVANDVDAFRDTFFIESDLEWIVKKVTEVDPKEGALAAKDLTPAYAREQWEEVKQSFKRSRSESAKSIDWDVAKLVQGVMVKEWPSGRSGFGLERAHIYFRVASGNREYVFKLDACHKVERGWVCADGLRHEGPANASGPR